MKRDLKYKTYKELLEAYKSGNLKEPLMMDNDDCFVYQDDVLVFKGSGQLDILLIAEAAGFIVEEV